MMRTKVLLIDRAEGELRELAHLLLKRGLEVFWARGEEELENFLTEDIDFIYLNLEIPGLGRLALLEKCLLNFPLVPLVVLSSEANLEEAVKAAKLGALDYKLLRTPAEELLLLLETSLDGKTFSSQGVFLTANRKLLALLTRLKDIAKSKATVLITGESGTGKEVLARFIHQESDRTKGPFIAINCAALPEHLLESELFGYEKGAFSGAFTRKLGKFELANGGTILLDEITEMPLSLQAKLLRVLQEGEVDRLGGAYPVKVDVRVIATTNREIETEVAKGHFREDLYFRLNVIPVRLPPLRERPEDIELLAQHFCQEFAKHYGRPVRGFAEGVLERLSQYSWPGNVRELRNMIERAVLLAKGPWITLSDLFPQELRPQQKKDTGLPLKPLKEVEKEMILKALKAANGNRTRAAEILGISVRTLRNKLQIYREAGIL